MPRPIPTRVFLPFLSIDRISLCTHTSLREEIHSANINTDPLALTLTTEIVKKNYILPFIANIVHTH